MLQAILGVATAISGAAAFPMYLIPNSMLKASFDNKDCIFPKGFVIQGFQIWSPTKANNHTTTVIDFHYSDYSTKIETGCHYNSTSVNVGPEGLVARYACNNAIVQFIWQNGTLTLIERACPELDLSRPFEAAGSVRPELTCVDAEPSSERGEGKSCFPTEGRMIAANFTSLQPTPR